MAVWKHSVCFCSLYAALDWLVLFKNNLYIKYIKWFVFELCFAVSLLYTEKLIECMVKQLFYFSCFMIHFSFTRHVAMDDHDIHVLDIVLQLLLKLTSFNSIRLDSCQHCYIHLFFNLLSTFLF
jgi:hypothetical protein